MFFFFSSRRRHTRSLCDWSSDVCSSDLPALWGRDTLTADEPGVAPRPGPHSCFARHHAVAATPAGELLQKIGRASCRERGEISVVAGALKKKKQVCRIPS